MFESGINESTSMYTALIKDTCYKRHAGRRKSLNELIRLFKILSP